MSFDLKKGSPFDLSKGLPFNTVPEFVLGLGFSGMHGKAIDLDSYIGVLDSKGEPIGFIYFDNKKYPGIQHNGDDLVGGGDSSKPNETIKLTLNDLPKEAHTLVVGMFIFTGYKTLGQLESSFMNITSSVGKEVCRYNLVEDFSSSTAVEAVNIVRSGSSWEVIPTGKGTNDSYRSIKSRYSAPLSSTFQRPQSFLSKLLDIIIEIFN